jgi:hypothetical protein
MLHLSPSPARPEVIRPLVLFGDRTPPQRAQETHTHPETVRQLRRRFRQQGMLGLLPADVEVVPRERASPIPAAVRHEIDRLKALYPDFHYRELARIVFCKVGYPIDDKMVKKLWHQSPVPLQPQLERWDYHTHPDRYQARVQVVKALEGADRGRHCGLGAPLQPHLIDTFFRLAWSGTHNTIPSREITERYARPDKLWSGPGHFSPDPLYEPRGDGRHA